MLKEKLKKALIKSGFNEELAEIINVTSEGQIDDIISQLKESQSSEKDGVDFNEILKSEAFEDFVKESGFDKVIDFSKTLQSEHDRKVTKGIATYSILYPLFFARQHKSISSICAKYL